MAKNSPYTGIRSYAELEASLRGVHTQIGLLQKAQDEAPLGIMSTQNKITWTVVGVMAVRLVRWLLTE